MSAVINELAVGGQTLPWKRLPMALACKRLYITGFPFECAPTIVDDKAGTLYQLGLTVAYLWSPRCAGRRR
jgi:hypothetical protein